MTIEIFDPDLLSSQDAGQTAGQSMHTPSIPKHSAAGGLL